jgi:predicted  nucleic acid-binding Zn-ribbon protein
MVETTDIEKKSLEAHVELCAERYNALENRLDHVDAKITHLSDMIREVHDMVQRMSEKRTDQLIGWGVGLIGTLTAAVIYLVTNYVLK